MTASEETCGILVQDAGTIIVHICSRFTKILDFLKVWYEVSQLLSSSCCISKEVEILEKPLYKHIFNAIPFLGSCREENRKKTNKEKPRNLMKISEFKIRVLCPNSYLFSSNSMTVLHAHSLYVHMLYTCPCLLPSLQISTPKVLRSPNFLLPASF